MPKPYRFHSIHGPNSLMAMAAGLPLRAKTTSSFTKDEQWRSAPVQKAYVQISPKIKARCSNCNILATTCTWSEKCCHDYLNEPPAGLGRPHGQTRYRLKALPSEVVSAVVAIVVVGSSVVALRQLSADKSFASSPQEKVQCEACDGSGLCSSCNGEGFQLKTLSPQAAAKARANAQDAATRYTAGLAKKWNYCVSCSGSRKCVACDGRGSLLTSERNS